jgi:hypothetical protein
MIYPPIFEQVRAKPWMTDRPFPVGTTMLSDEEIVMLRWIAKNAYSGEGSILDCGCFLGGSTCSLAQGLMENPIAAKKIHSYDLFAAGLFESKAFAHVGLELDKSFRHLYERNIAPCRELVEIHEGDITQSVIPEGSIEILFIDCAKLPVVNDFFVTKLFPRLIPGKSLVIQQDYLYPHSPWLHITMEYFADYFALLSSTECNSVIYGCIKSIPPKAAIGCAWNMMSRSVKHLLMQQAINRWEGKKRQFVIGAYASYDLDADKPGWGLIQG